MLQTANAADERAMCVEPVLVLRRKPVCAFVRVHILKARRVVLPGVQRFYEARRSFNTVFLLAKADITGETKWNSGTVG